jgi:hypothetical protein
MASRNCLKCIHFTKSIVYEYSKNGNNKSIQSVLRILKCDKLNLVFQMRNSEEKDNESLFIKNKCVDAKYFVESYEIKPEKVVWIDV